MKLLLDTHAFIWFITGDGQLSSTARTLIEDETNEKYVSAATPWEMAIKASLGKLTLQSTPSCPRNCHGMDLNIYLSKSRIPLL